MASTYRSKKMTCMRLGAAQSAALTKAAKRAGLTRTQILDTVLRRFLKISKKAQAALLEARVDKNLDSYCLYLEHDLDEALGEARERLGTPVSFIVRAALTIEAIEKAAGV